MNTRNTRSTPLGMVAVMLALLGSSLAASSTTAIATGEPQRLIELREIYRRQQPLVRVPIAKAYFDQLAMLHQRLSRTGQLEAAIEVRDEGRMIRNWIEETTQRAVSPSDSASTQIPADATLASLRRDYREELAASAEVLKLKYLIALEKLERSLVKDGRRDAAMIVVRESYRIENLRQERSRFGTQAS